MFQFLAESEDDRLYVRVRLEDKPAMKVLSFPLADNGVELLRFLHFLSEYDEEEALFGQSENLLPAELHWLLFYFYLEELARQPDRPKSQADFGRNLMQRKKEMTPWVATLAKPNAACDPLPLKLMVTPTGNSVNFHFDKLADFLQFELLLLLKNHTEIHTCAVCGSLFIAEKRMKGQLCPYPHANRRSCLMERCRNNAKAKRDSDPLLQTYKRIYKRNYMRCDRLLNAGQAGGPVLPGEDSFFREWTQKLQEIRLGYMDKKLSPEQFRESLQLMDRLFGELIQVRGT